MDCRKELGKKIRSVRQAKGLTQERLAELSDVSLNFIGLTERGVNMPSVMTCEKIARSLDVTLGELFSFEKPGKPATGKDREIAKLNVRLKAAKEKQVGLILHLADVVLKSD